VLNVRETSSVILRGSVCTSVNFIEVMKTSRLLLYRDKPYFPAYKTHRPIRRTLIFSLEILEKITNVF
jgi:hypothetical protein